MKLISIIIPARNEEETIGRVLEELFSVIKKLKKYKFEVLVINDGSKDDTAIIAKTFGINVINNQGSHGKGNALKLAFEKAKGTYIIMMDADYSHRGSDIQLFIEQIEKGCDMVIGSRQLGGSDEYEMVRAIGNVALTFIFRMFFKIQLTDVLNGFKAFKRDLIKKHTYSSKGFEMEVELVANALRSRYRICEIPSHERKRAGGKMKSHAFREGSLFFMEILKEGIKYRLGFK